MVPKVAINGFGRIGRDVFRANLAQEKINIVAINNLCDVETTAHLLKYDSLYGKLNAEIKVKDKNTIEVNGKEIKVYAERDPENLPWGDLGIDIVVEATGVFCHREGASKHITAGAKKVVITAPGKDVDKTIVLGVNEKTIDKENDKIISNASCTTNCLAPIAKVLNDKFEIEKGLMTTIHAYTNDQKILDVAHTDLRRARAAGLSMIPTTTGAAKAVGEVLPELKGKLNGFAMRVPTPTVSVVDLTVELKKEVTVEEINQAIKEASGNELKGILGYNQEPLVSIDFQGDARSSIFDPAFTVVIGNMVKVLSWYDNEWGYSNRVVDLCKYLYS